MTCRLAILILAIVGFGNCCTSSLDTRSRPTPIEYQVYSNFLEHQLSDKGTLVVSQSTNRYGMEDWDSFCFAEDSTLDSSTLAIVNTLQPRADTAYLDGASLGLRRPYCVLSKQLEDSIFMRNDLKRDIFKVWENFDQRFPGGDLVYLSRISFSPDSVYAVFVCYDIEGPKSGLKALYLMKRLGTDWSLLSSCTLLVN